ncbi:MAG: sensor histidine kinase [Campylobacterota bacterium]
MIEKIRSVFDNITFKAKTNFLIFVIAGGMVSIIILSQVSIYVIKSDFQTLYENRTKPLVDLENLKDTYEINVKDTITAMQAGHISKSDGMEVLALARQLAEEYWHSYKNAKNSKEHNPLLGTLKKLFVGSNAHDKNTVLFGRLMQNIDRKVQTTDSYLQDFSAAKTRPLINEINALKVYITSLIDYDLQVIISEKRQTDTIFTYLFGFSVVSIFAVFALSLFLSYFLLAHFKKIHGSLEQSVDEKTDQLLELNRSLEKRIAKEVKNSRKKDMVMFQQAKLASMGEMLQNIAHQWRQPLGSLTMIIQSFQTKMEHGKLTKEFVDKKVGDALLLSRNMSQTLEDFRNFFNPERAKSTFALKTCIQHAFELSKYHLQSAHIRYTIKIKDDVVIHSYYNELSHVLLNLISNAKDAFKDKKCRDAKMINVTVKKGKDKVYIHFSDNAGGIDPRIVSKIFEPYFTTKYKSAGTGVGLYMSKQIIEAHMGGAIWYKSVPNNLSGCKGCKSALFSIELPL